jgi:glycyl-tRNA synthetase beta chain
LRASWIWICIALLERAATGFEAAIRAEKAVETVFDFIMDRLRSYYLDQGMRPDTFEAVLECRRPAAGFRPAVRAVSAFRELPEAASLGRRQQAHPQHSQKNRNRVAVRGAARFADERRNRRWPGGWWSLSSEVIPLMEAGLYGEALNRLASLREPVDAFFDQVLVMAEDAALRDNRIALLNELGSLFLRVADFRACRIKNRFHGFT